MLKLRFDWYIIARNDSFITSFLNTCSSAFNNVTTLEFDSLLGMKPSLNAIAKKLSRSFFCTCLNKFVFGHPHQCIQKNGISVFVFISKL